MAELIQVEDLRKDFKVPRGRRGLGGFVRNILIGEYNLVHAVAGVTFTVQPGELLGYLGPNGAGKSTTLKILSGLLAPSSGIVHVAGRVPYLEREKHVAGIGAVFGQRTTLWWDLPVIESLELVQFIYRVPGERFRSNLKEFRELLELDTFLNTPVRSLSLGQRMRADLCAALLHDPPLLFLDEPTIGLDVVAKERIRQFVQYVNRERGTTVLLTTHDISDVEKLCERVLIIDRGRLLYDGQLDGLRERFGGKRALVVEFAEVYTDVNLPGLEPPDRDGLRATYTFERGSLTASHLINQLSARFRIRDLEVREPVLEETIRRIYEERLLDAS